MTAEPTARVELQQSSANALQLPILIGLVIAALSISDIARGPGVVWQLVCAAGVVVDVMFARYLMRNFKAVLVVTRDDITFTRGRSGRQQIKRVEASSLVFRTARNGPMGSQYTGYVLKLRDTATGDEVYAGAFGRAAAQKACEAQGWTFA